MPCHWFAQQAGPAPCASSDIGDSHRSRRGKQPEPAARCGSAVCVARSPVVILKALLALLRSGLALLTVDGAPDVCLLNHA